MTGPSLPSRPMRRGELVAADGGLAALLTVGYLAVLVPGPGSDVPGPPWWTYLIVLFMGVPLVFRRFWPLPVLLLVSAASVLALSLGVLREPFLAVALASYTTATDESRLGRRAWTALGCVSLVLLLLSFSAGVVGPWQQSIALLLPGSALVAAMWTVGVAVRERRAYAARSGTERTARAVAEERLRIAREMHDIVSHNLGIIAVKAAVARHVAQSRPGEAQDALAVIDEVSQAALGEMRLVLNLLRSPPHNGDDEQPEPLPVVADLRALVGRVSATGLRVDSQLSGCEGLPEGTAVSTYRIVQEALTNVLKHAGPGAHCEVIVRCEDHAVLIEVRDDGPVDQAPDPRRTGDGGGGHGLLGMRERVSMYGGHLWAGPREDAAGFEVRARLPYRADVPLAGARGD